MSVFTKTDRPILEPMPDVKWASGAVFNPAAWYDGRVVHLLFRAIADGYNKISLEEPPERGPDLGFDNYVSTIGYARSDDGLTFEVRPEPFIHPDCHFDRFGAEDPRLTYLDDRYFITYTALASEAFGPEDGIRIGLASTADFRSVEKHGIIGPPERDKDAVVFPERIGGRIAMLHRIVPDIQVVYFDDVEQLCRPPDTLWRDHMAALDQNVIMRPREVWEEKKIGAGPTPIPTDSGWLLIYHGVDRHHVYRAGFALLDRDDPARVIARTRRPILEPELEFERFGDVDNVVFPEGAIVIDDVLHVYYGAADRVVGHAKAPLSDVLEAVLSDV